MHDQCSVPVVAQLVKEQVGYDIILLNNKLYPILDAPSTRGDFWRSSSRKILAASAKLYEKITGKRPKAKGLEIDLTGNEDIGSPPASPSAAKKQKFEEEVKTGLDDIKQHLQHLEKQSMFEDEVKRAFECVICKQAIRQPVMAGCCQRLVGCMVCLETWLSHSPVCPLCKSSCIITTKMELKGFDDLLALLPQGTSAHHEARLEAEHELSEYQGHEDDREDADFEEPPPF